MIQTVNKNDVMQMTGLSKTQAQNLIKQAKLQMVKKGFQWYANKRVAQVPIKAVEEILGYQINTKNDIIEDVISDSVVIDKETFNDNN